MQHLNMFAQLRKVDEEKRLVFGRLAEEAVDNAGEIMDYMSSKPHFQKWSADIAKDTDGKNLGNVRAMHGKVAAGMLTKIDFDDEAKTIDVCAHVVDDAEWKKVLAGVYTGFSVGGDYVGEKKVEKVDGVDAKRYTARPNEASLVDRPCIKGAKFFEVQKVDGSTAKVDFIPNPVADDMEVTGTAEELAELGKMMNTEGLSLGDLVKALPAFLAAKKKKGAADADDKGAGKADDETDPKDAAKDAKDAKKVATPGELRKGVYDCSSFSSVLSQLVSLQSSAAYEAMREGDNGMAGKISAIIALTGNVFKELIDEVIKSTATASDSPAGTAMLALSTQAGDLTKAVSGDFVKHDEDPIVALMKIGARNSAADQGRLAKIHDLAVELGHTCDPAAKGEPSGDLSKLDAGGLQKMIDAAVEPLTKALGTANEEIKLLKAQPAPARISLRAVDKGDEMGGTVAKVDEVKPIVDDKGEVHDAASLIKSLHSKGGMPLTLPQELRK